MDEFEQMSLGMQLAMMTRGWRAAVDKAMEPLGLTQARWVALLHLSRLGEGTTQSCLAQHVGIELPSLMRTLDCLEKQDLITRHRCDNDRRARTIHFTDEGRVLMQAIQGRSHEVHQHLLQGFSADEVAILEGMIARIASNTVDITQGDTPGCCDKAEERSS
ncbi:transcriptional regulator SlyA [Larsenimonas rhizosphaerae]|uniref:Transcriptional regulator SlyA n=1 Tax=Larsenimonas rhizosphaerae TaxID=2944682 RepID=A0AA41ZK09_9GAMM|nr:transcriptional regulator SlyA [Larsenimonas rhizosphaerae]MCM2130597.1 transcriptional regulator SlyA [Larsenimonas rhizosphaerae]MCX2523301.1 transcriptional regulator SlyA [Larsenimonas rhizosphaerae]